MTMSINAIAAGQFNVVSGASSFQSVTNNAHVNPSDTAYFQKVTSANIKESSQSNFEHTPSNSNIDSINKNPPPGDGASLQKITNSLDSISTGIREKTLAIQSMIGGQQRPPSMSEMLRIQMSIAQLSLQTQWFGDIVSKAGKNVDQLTHLQ
jgi:hypothetical protein